MLKKRYTLNWMLEVPDAILTCSILKCKGENYVLFGGHDKTLYVMDLDLNMLDQVSFDGWCRCTYPIDMDGDGIDEVLVGTGDGSCLVMKFDPESKKLNAIMKYLVDGKVSCCIAGDIFRNGKTQLIYAGEDKTLSIFDDFRTKEPRFTLYYDSWVNSCALGYLKLPKMTKPVYGLLVGTRNGLLQFIQVITKGEKVLLDIIWQRDFNSAINFIAVGDVANDADNEIVIATNDSYIKILDSEGNSLKYIRVYNDKSISSSRPLAVILDDIDGDNANEIIVGCADGNFRVYHNTSLKSVDFQLKWKTKVSTSIKHICTIDDKENPNIKHLIFGGYDRTLRHVTDFEWGKKQALNISRRSIPPKIDALKDEVSDFKPEAVPINLREHILKIFEEREVVANLDMLSTELVRLGYAEDLVADQMNMLKTSKVIQQKKKNDPLWMLSGKEVKQPMETSPIKIRRDEPEEETEIELESNDLINLAKEIHEDLKASKNIKEMRQIRSKFDLLIAMCNDDVKRVVKGEDKEQTVKAENSPDEIKENVLRILTENEIFKTKADFIDAIAYLGYDVELIEQQIDLLKSEEKIMYSKSNPRGWMLK